MVPDTAKLRLAWLAGSRVAELATVCWMVPVVTGTVTVVIVSPLAVGESDVSQSGSAIAAAMMTTAAVPMAHRYRRHTEGGSGGSTFSSSSGNSSGDQLGSPARRLVPLWPCSQSRPGISRQAQAQL